MMTTVPMFLLLYSSCMMHPVFIMFLWLVFIDKLRNDNSDHVCVSCHVFKGFIHESFIHSETFTETVILRDPKMST